MFKKIILMLAMVGAQVQVQAQVRTQAMALDEYLQAVGDASGAYKSARNQAEGSTLQGREADLIFTPHFFAEATTGFDEKLQNPPVFKYDRANSTAYSLGVAQQFRFGVEAKFSYSMTQTELRGADPALLGGNTQFADGIGAVELSLPLWKNGFGRTARAKEEMARQQAMAASYGSSAQMAQVLSEAEGAYWRMAAASEQVGIEERTLRSAREVLNYVERQNRKNLGEHSDVLQARAMVDAYTLQLQQAQNELAAARRSFNFFLNKSSEAPVPVLSGFDFVNLEKLEIPQKRTGDRADVKAAEAQAALAQASSVEASERNKPSLDLIGKYATNGQANSAGDAMGKVGAFDTETSFVGIRFSIPLNASATSDARKGAEKTRLAADEGLRQAKFAQEQQWNDLVQMLSDARNALKMTGTIEKAHQTKLEYEKTRHRQGRSTTYQILMFEQDYNRAQSARIRAASQVLALQAQAKLYGFNSEGGK